MHFYSTCMAIKYYIIDGDDREWSKHKERENVYQALSIKTDS